MVPEARCSLASCLRPRWVVKAPEQNPQREVAALSVVPRNIWKATAKVVSSCFGVVREVGIFPFLCISNTASRVVYSLCPVVSVRG